MNEKTKSLKLILAICIVLGLVTTGIAQNSPSTTRQKLLQTVGQAKKETGYMSAALISPLIKSIEAGKDEFVTEELVPDYISFSKDKNIFVQQLGVAGLSAVKSPKAVEALFEYVKNKDYADWEKRLKDLMNPNNTESWQLQYELETFRKAVDALGESRDKRFVPFLLELFKSTNPNSAQIIAPVGQALGKLGATRELFDMVPEANTQLFIYIHYALKSVKDPNKVPELKTIINDPNENTMVRCFAVSTLSGIEAAGVSEFLISIINDQNYLIEIRQTAMGAASLLKDPAAEKTLLVYAQDRDSPLRYSAFVGLLRCMPDKYIDRFFETIMDPNEELNFRRQLISEFNQSIQQDLLKKYWKQLHDCLNASDRNGRPVDEIRIVAWEQINKVFQEEPSVVLNDRNSGTILNAILDRITKENINLSYQEKLKKAEEETQRIVSVYDDEQKSQTND